MTESRKLVKIHNLVELNFQAEIEKLGMQNEVLLRKNSNPVDTRHDIEDKEMRIVSHKISYKSIEKK